MLAFVSDQLITLHPTKECRVSELRTEITRRGANPSNWEADISTFLNLPLRGLPDNSQLMHSHAILPAAYNTPAGRNCTIHQISVHLGECYHKLCDQFRAH